MDEEQIVTFLLGVACGGILAGFIAFGIFRRRLAKQKSEFNKLVLEQKDAYTRLIKRQPILDTSNVVKADFRKKRKKVPDSDDSGPKSA